MKPKISPLLTIIYFVLIGCSSDDVPRNTFNELVFEENFNGTEVDLSVWGLYDGNGHNNNGLRKPSAISVANGSLIITAEMKDGTLISGGMAHQYNFRYGRVEFRVRTEDDASEATSGVVLTWPQSEQWPEDGEIDIYETTTVPSRNPFYTFIHYDISNQQKTFIHTNQDGSNWHDIAMEWTSDKIDIYRDGTLVYTEEEPTIIPDVNHHICIQLDAFKNSMESAVKMYVDYVRIYR